MFRWFHEEASATSMESSTFLLKDVTKLGHHCVILMCAGDQL